MLSTATKEKWDLFKDQINMLYIKENRQLEGRGGVIEVMQKRFSFTATKAQYESKLKKWGFSKYAKGAQDKDWQIMLYKFESRRSKTGREPQVYYLGKRITPRVIKDRGFMKYTERNVLEQAPSPQTPSDFSICTSSPSPTPDLNQRENSGSEDLPIPATYISPTENTDNTLEQGLPYDIPFANLNNSMDVGYTQKGNSVSATHLSPTGNINTTTSLEFSSDILFAGLSDSIHLDFVTSPGGGIIFRDAPSESEFLGPSLNIYRSLSPDLLGHTLLAPHWDNLPWSLFRRAIGRSIISHRMASGSSPNSNSIEIGDRQQKVLLLDGISSQRFTTFFEDIIPKQLDGELAKTVRRFLDTSTPLYTSQIVELFMALISNNIIFRKGVRQFFDMVMKYSATDILRDLFSIKTPTIQAVVTRILEVLVEDGEDSALALMLDAVVDQGNLAGDKGGRLLQLATYAGSTEIAKVLLEYGADANPKRTDYDPSPLHIAVQKNNPELVSCLIESGAIIECFDEFEQTALSHAVLLDRPECVELLLCRGAMVDTCKVTDGRETAWSNFNANLDAIDYAYLKGSRKIYDLLLTHSQKAREHITTHGVLHAAKSGLKVLQMYMNGRKVVGGRSREAILEEILVLALYHSGPGEATNTLLSFGVDPNVPTYDATYIDHPLISVMEDGVSAFSHLVAAGANINDQKIINVATCKRHLQILNFIIQRGVSLDLFGVDALASAASYDNLDAIELLLRYGVNPNKRSSYGMYPIQEAAHHPSFKTVEYLLHHGADPNAPPCRREGRTALHYAVYNKNMEIVQLLIEFGAEITPQDPRIQFTILETLCNRLSRSMLPREKRLFEFLLNVGADINHPRPEYRLDSWVPILSMLIERRADYDLIRRVLNTGVDVNEAGTAHYTAIQAAAAVGNLELVKELFNRGADINAPAVYSSGRTALQAACSSDEINMGLITFLFDNGADINARAGVKWGLTALQGAAIEGHIGLVSLLQERGANVNAPPAIVDGRTALEGAAEHGRLDMVQLLLNFGGRDGKGGYDGAVKLAEKNGHWAVADLLTHHKASQMHIDR